MHGFDEEGSRQSRVPHYALRTVTHSAPEFANHEQDMIRQSFAAGNHTWMKEALPTDLGPDAVNLHRRQRMERNRLAEPVPQTWSKMTQLWGGGYYQEFEYIPDAYDSRKEKDKLDRLESVSKREKIAINDWRHASQERKLTHDSSFGPDKYPYLGGDKDKEVPARHPNHRVPRWLEPMCTGKHWDHSKEEELIPKRSTESSGFLAGKGSGLDDGSRMSRMMLPQIVEQLQQRLDDDWDDTTVVVSATDQDLVQVAFHMATVDSERGVLAYMNVLAKDVDVIGALGLRKAGQLWGTKRDLVDAGASASAAQGDAADAEHTWMFFLLVPKWVKMRPTDAHYTVHPRTNGSAFRMSTAGSSVLCSLSGGMDPMQSSRSVQDSSRSAQDRERQSKPKPNIDVLMQAATTLPKIV